MSINVEKQLDIITCILTAEKEEDRERAREALRQMVSAETVPASTADSESIIAELLRDLGIASNIKGYRYTIKAVSIIVEEPDILDEITKGLYPRVAEQCQTTTSRVERAIRHAIETGWDRIDVDTAIRYFGNTVNPRKGKPTNSEFLARVSDIARKLIKEGF